MVQPSTQVSSTLEALQVENIVCNANSSAWLARALEYKSPVDFENQFN